MKRAGGFLLALLGVALASACYDNPSNLIHSATPSEAGECSDDAQCGADRPHCEADSQRCVQCLGNIDCQDGSVCALPAGTCVLGCEEAGCPFSTPICDESTDLCRACTEPMDCLFTEFPYCETSTGRCVECITTGHCDEADEECSSVLGLCAPPCAADNPCVTDDIYCDEAIGYCVQCQFDEQCEGDEVCRNSECQGDNDR